MPNIEIHGLPREEAEALRGKVFVLFNDESYVGEMVVTIFPTTVEDVYGSDQPFIRFANSCQLHTEDILERLQTLGIDIEHLKLEAFLPKKE